MEWRLGHYADVLGFTGRFIQVWREAAEEDDESVLPLTLSPREVRAALLTLMNQVSHLERQVETLEQLQQPRTRRAVKR